MVSGVGTVVVVGAGLAGLSAACHLAGQGAEVVVVERADVPGGRAGRFERDGYLFDTGPSVLTMPGLLADTFAAAGVEMASMLELEPVDPAYRACFADGSELRVHADPAVMGAEIAAVCGPAEEVAYHRFRDWLRRLYELEMPHFIARDYDSPLDLVRRPGPALRLVGMGGFGRMGPTVARFFTDDRLRRLFSFQAMYAGLAPRRALAAYATITHMDTMLGVWFPVGGMHAVPTALARAAGQAGAEIRYGATAREVVLDRSSGAVSGVRLQDGELVRGDAGGVHHRDGQGLRGLACRAWRRLDGYAGPATPRPVCSGTPVSRERFLRASLTTTCTSAARWDAAFDTLIDQGRVMPDPSTLVTVPTVSDPALAPEQRR